MSDSHGTGTFPKISLDTLANLELAGMSARRGPSRDAEPSLRLDSMLLVDFTDALSVDALFQFKPRKPLAVSDPNKDLFINQGAGRAEGGKLKELYVRYGNFRLGKFVQDFGRAYALLPGPYAADFIEEAEQGYETSDMIGGEWLHVFENEEGGWRQISFSAFMVDRTFLHESFPFNEGLVRYKDGGVANTRLPENLMLTYDVFNKPIGNWAQLTTQASVVRYGRSYGAQRGEIWSTLGGDLAVPIRGSVASTLSGDYAQIRVYAEATRRQNFEGSAGRRRDFLSGSIEFLTGHWVYDFTTTQRWTSDRIRPLQKDELYTLTLTYNFPRQTAVALSVANEHAAERDGIYAGLRITHAFSACNRCLMGTRAF